MITSLSKKLLRHYPSFVTYFISADEVIILKIFCVTREGFGLIIKMQLHWTATISVACANKMTKMVLLSFLTKSFRRELLDQKTTNGVIDFVLFNGEGKQERSYQFCNLKLTILHRCTGRVNSSRYLIVKIA